MKAKPVIEAGNYLIVDLRTYDKFLQFITDFDVTYEYLNENHEIEDTIEPECLLDNDNFDPIKHFKECNGFDIQYSYYSDSGRCTTLYGIIGDIVFHEKIETDESDDYTYYNVIDSTENSKILSSMIDELTKEKIKIDTMLDLLNELNK
jgi:hypothetical protein